MLSLQNFHAGLLENTQPEIVRELMKHSKIEQLKIINELQDPAAFIDGVSKNSESLAIFLDIIMDTNNLTIKMLAYNLIPSTLFNAMQNMNNSAAKREILMSGLFDIIKNNNDPTPLINLIATLDFEDRRKVLANLDEAQIKLFAETKLSPKTRLLCMQAYPDAFRDSQLKCYFKHLREAKDENAEERINTVFDLLTKVLELEDKKLTLKQKKQYLKFEINKLNGDKRAAKQQDVMLKPYSMIEMFVPLTEEDYQNPEKFEYALSHEPKRVIEFLTCIKNFTEEKQKIMLMCINPKKQHVSNLLLYPQAVYAILDLITGWTEPLFNELIKTICLALPDYYKQEALIDFLPVIRKTNSGLQIAFFKKLNDPNLFLETVIRNKPKIAPILLTLIADKEKDIFGQMKMKLMQIANGSRLDIIKVLHAFVAMQSSKAQAQILGLEYNTKNLLRRTVEYIEYYESAIVFRSPIANYIPQLFKIIAQFDEQTKTYILSTLTKGEVKKIAKYYEGLDGLTEIFMSYCNFSNELQNTVANKFLSILFDAKQELRQPIAEAIFNELVQNNIILDQEAEPEKALRDLLAQTSIVKTVQMKVEDTVSSLFRSNEDKVVQEIELTNLSSNPK